MADTRANWSNEIPDVGLKLADFFDQGQNLYTPGIHMVLTKTTGSGAQKNYEGKTTAGELKFTAEGDDAKSNNRYLSYLTQVAYNKYTGSLEVTEEMLDDRDFDGAFNEATELGRVSNFSIDKAGMQLFNGGFATTTTVNGYVMTFYGDGKPTFSTVHPTKVPGGSTQSNASSTGIVFSHDNLEIATIALIEQADDAGLPQGTNGKPMIVVPSQLVREAREETESELDPSSANNAINVWRGHLDMTSSLFISGTFGGSNTAWFLVTPGQDKQFFEMRKAPSLELDKAVRSGTTVFVTKGRWANWVGDWRMKWGSKGDNNAYAS